MLKVIFFAVFIMSLFSVSIYGQSDVSNPPQPYKFAEFGPTSAKEIASKMVAFDDELNAKEAAQGYIVNYGPAKAIRIRRSLLMKGISYRKYDTARMIWLDGPFEKKIRTVLWIVPPGAAFPKVDAK